MDTVFLSNSGQRRSRTRSRSRTTTPAAPNTRSRSTARSTGGRSARSRSTARNPCIAAISRDQRDSRRTLLRRPELHRRDLLVRLLRRRRVATPTQARPRARSHRPRRRSVPHLRADPREGDTGSPPTRSPRRDRRLGRRTRHHADRRRDPVGRRSHRRDVGLGPLRARTRRDHQREGTLRVGATISRSDVFPEEKSRLSSTWGRATSSLPRRARSRSTRSVSTT